MYTRVFFRVNLPNTSQDSSVIVTGSSVAMGEWEPRKGVSLYTQDNIFPNWTNRDPVLLPLKEKLEYKYVVVDHDSNPIYWYPTENMDLVPTGVEMVVEDDDGTLRSRLDRGVSVQWGNRSFSGEMPSMHQLPGDDSEIDEALDVLYVVSMELPVQVRRTDEGDFTITGSPSMLLPSLFNLRKSVILQSKFIGFPGVFPENENERQRIEELLSLHDCIPVFVPELMMAKYREFCSYHLGHVMHSFMMTDTEHDVDDLWMAYQQANKLYSDVVYPCVHEGDMLWIHDYPLLLLPQFLTRKNARANVGLFLHSPFPAAEVFRCFNKREEILRSMLCADLLGFHFFEYTRNFLETCRKSLGLEHNFKMGGYLGVEYLGRNVTIRLGHASLDANAITDACQDEELHKKAAIIRHTYNKQGRYMIVGIDAPHHLSGVLQKLRIMKTVFQEFPNLRGRVILTQYMYPSDRYGASKAYLDRVQSLAAELNTAYREYNDGEDVVNVVVQATTTADRRALFIASDALMVGSLRDGLNLTPFEYIICKGHDGAMLVSDLSGCSSVLASAIRINPYSAWDSASKIDEMISLSPVSREDKIKRDLDYVHKHTTLAWAKEILLDVRSSRKPQGVIYQPYGFGCTMRVLGMDSSFKFLPSHDVVSAYNNATCRAFFLDNEGTLAPDKRQVVDGSSLEARGSPPSEAVKDILCKLSEDPNNYVVILSGRDRERLTEWFGDIKNLGLCAEHGFFIRMPHLPDWECLSEQTDFAWKNIAWQLMNEYAKRTPGVLLENKGSALVFQYRGAEQEFGLWQAKELSSYLSEMMFGHPVTVTSGKGYVEVKLRGVNKGRAASSVVSSIYKEPDFVLCIGDDRSDESMFSAVNQLGEDRPECAYFTATVGKKPTAANYYLNHIDEVSDILESIVALRNRKLSL